MLMAETSDWNELNAVDRATYPNVEALIRSGSTTTR